MNRLILLPLLAAAAFPAFAHDVDPNGFEKQHSASSTLTRDEVSANMKKPAIITMKIDDQGRLITAPSTKSRAQVVAETQAAAKMGLMRFGELGPMEATPAQEDAIRVAGRRALEQGDTGL